MRVETTTALPVDTAADTVAVGLFDGEGIAHDVDEVLAGLVERREARPKRGHLGVAHAGGKRWIVVGLGARDGFDADRARTAAATALGRARDLAARHLCWELPHRVDDDVAAALVEGTVLAAYRFDRFRRAPEREDGLEALTLAAHGDVAAAAARGEALALAANRARDLQNTPANVMTPTRLAEAARELAAEAEGVGVEVEGRAGIEALGMGCFAAVARGTDEEPALITLRYEPPDATQVRGPVLGLVGKAVTFDTGGISIKPANKMAEMKFDMSGGAAVLGAVRAIAALRLPIRVLGVVGATENMPSGHALKPGDVVRALDGTTVEVLNTDAEGRLVLADCLVHALREGAERLVDVATLTGAIVTALGSTHAGLMASDDAWATAVEGAARRAGELCWRLPLHPDYDELLSSQVADLVNVNEARKAGSIVAAQFLKRFTGEVPWAHLDIAGVAWDLGKPPVAKGGSAFGVRLLVELARSLAGEAG